MSNAPVLDAYGGRAPNRCPKCGNVLTWARSQFDPRTELAPCKTCGYEVRRWLFGGDWIVCLRDEIR